MDPLDRPVPAPQSVYGQPGSCRDELSDNSSSDGEDDVRGPPTTTADIRAMDRLHASANRQRWRPSNSRDAPMMTGSTSHSAAAAGPQNRLYSYMSGSDGEEDQLRPTGRRAGHRPNDRGPAAGHGDAVDALSSCSSLSSVHSSSPSDVDNRARLVVGGQRARRSVDRMTDTMDSAGRVGENVYSRINEPGLFPMLPPPPPSEPPAVPVRRAVARVAGIQTLGRRPPAQLPVSSAAAYMDSDSSDTPRFLMHTASGNVFIPSGVDTYQGGGGGPPAVSAAAVPTFPRTVPRTISVQRGNDHAGFDNAYRMSVVTDRAASPPQTAHAPSSSSSSAHWQQQQPANGDVTSPFVNSTTPGERSNMVPRLPGTSVVRPGTQFSYPRYCGTTYPDSPYSDDKKYSVCRRSLTWKCAALVLLLVVIALVVVLAYLLAVHFYNLSQREGAVYADSKDASGTSLQLDPSSIASYQLGDVFSDTVGGHGFLRAQFYLDSPTSLRVTVAVPRGAVAGFFARRSAPPSFTRYDVFHAVDANKVVPSTASSRRRRRSTHADDTMPPTSSSASSSSVIDSTFIRHMDSGLWFVSVYNDGDAPRTLSFTATPHDAHSAAECPDSCSDHGDCINRECRCFPGYTGSSCAESVCPALCSGNGEYESGRCKCYGGWTGDDCQVPSEDCAGVYCSQHGQCVDGRCVCATGFTGVDCFHELCTVDCGAHGRCSGQRCQCDEGWSGTTCTQRACDPRCTASSHGHCNNGTCVCQPGWNGKHCTLDGCPNGCGTHGTCRLFFVGWACTCLDGWKGTACQIAMETACDSGADEDEDGLTDCEDPDCCVDMACRESIYCRIAPDPMEILLRKQPPSTGASFYDRMRFLVEDESVQSYATLSSFNQTQVSVIRGRVVTEDASSLVGVRVSVVTQPLYGFTLTREQGLFDILANGGGSVTLHFQRQPFQSRRVTVFVPWNRIMVMDVVTMTLDGRDASPASAADAEDEQDAGACDMANIQHDYYSLRPSVVSLWRDSHLPACSSAATSLIPETQVLRESLHITGTGFHLVHDSSDAPGYMSTLLIALTGQSVPRHLVIVRLRVVVEGVVFERDLEADVNLQYRFTWDRRNAYNQKVYGVVTAIVAVGYVYENCASRPYWEVQSAKIAGSDMMSSEIGGWNVDVHHVYSIQEGIVYKGDGSNMYLKMSPRSRRLAVVLGDSAGQRRRVDCQRCDGPAAGNLLLSPLALASGRDGALYIGDYNYIRRLSPARDDVATILQLSVPDVHYKYYMVVSPLDGRLYITDQQNLRIIRVKTMGAVRELTQNFEVVAGTGQQCIPGDLDQCGDASSATDARLFYPKGIAIDKDGVVYFADGANIRAIDEVGNIRTLIGAQAASQQWTPFPCHKVLNVSQVSLRWPTALAVNPLDNTLHILDNGLVLKLTRDNHVIIVAGRSPLCPPTNSSTTSSDEDSSSAAVDSVLEYVENLAFSPDGDLFLVESDGEAINRLRFVDSAGRLRHYTGTQCPCPPTSPTPCLCSAGAGSSTLDVPSAVTLTPDGVVHIADTGLACVHSAVGAEPTVDRYGKMKIVDAAARELYVFNRYGQHLSTVDLLTGVQLYNFTYNVHSYFGRLLKITDAGGQQMTIRRDYKLVARDIWAASGARCRLATDTMNQLQRFVSGDNVTTRFSYYGNTGLIESRDDQGSVRLVEYDDVGHVTSLVLANGKRVWLSEGGAKDGRACFDVTGDVSTVAMTVGDSGTTFTRGGTTTVTSHTPNSVTARLPSNTLLTYELGDQLPGVEYQLDVKRVIQLPSNVTHTAEWWHQLRHDDYRGNRARRDTVVRRLLVNGEPLLSVEYDEKDNSETVYGRGRDRLLTVRYDSSGRPVRAIPAGPLDGLNVTYDSRGRVTAWWRGDLAGSSVYDDRTGLPVEQRLANKILRRFIYKAGNKPTDVILASGRQYQLHYDDQTGALTGVTTPALAFHQFSRTSSLGVDRVVYLPPSSVRSAAGYTQFRDSTGRVIQELYPSGHRRVTRYFDVDDGRRDVVYVDWTDVVFERSRRTGVIIRASLLDRAAANFTATIHYAPDYSPLVASQTVTFTAGGPNSASWGLVDASFRYEYNTSTMSVVAIDAAIGDRTLRTLNYNYSSDTGRLNRIQMFSYQFPRAHREVVRDSNVEIVRDFDSRGRATDVWFRFNNYVVFALEVKHDQLGRIHQWRRKVGSSDLRAYERVYNVDGDVTEVHVSGQPTWRYSYDADANIIRASHHDKTRSFVVDAVSGRLDSAGEVSYVHDADGRVVQRGRESFEYTAAGALTRAFDLGRHDVTFHHDAWGRLAVRRDAMAGEFVQFFYADLDHPRRVTHVVDGVGGGAEDGGGSRWRVTELFYDTRGKLFAMRRESELFYVAVDPTDSPIVVLNGVGSVVKQVDYDPLGDVIGDSAPDFLLPFGFRCGVVDTASRLVVFVDGRAYDPSVGRWMVPDYRRLVASVESLSVQPQLTSLYRAASVLWDQQSSDITLVTDISSWLSQLGYEYSQLVPAATRLDRRNNLLASLQSSADVTAAESYSTRSLVECALQRADVTARRMSVVRRSKVVSSPARRRHLPRALTSQAGIFGRGVVVSEGRDGRLAVTVVDGTDTERAVLATTLFNASQSVGLPAFVVFGRDVHHFVHHDLQRAADDFRALGLEPDLSARVAGLNMTIHRGASHVEVRLHDDATWVSVRYGATVRDLRAHLLRRAAGRAADAAWAVERERAQSGKRRITGDSWTRRDLDELLSRGHVTGYTPVYVRDVIDRFPLLADDPYNIRFVPGR